MTKGMNVEINSSKQGVITVVSVTGRLDAGTASELEKHLLTLLDGNDKFLLIDFEGLNYISSVGLRVLLIAAKKAKASGGKIVLSSLQEHVMEIFEISGFTTIFPIFPTRSEALENYR